MRHFFNQFEEYFVALMLAAMTVLTCVNVFFRYVLGTSLSWVYELNTFLFAWLIFIGASWGLRVGAHIGVDLLVKQFRPARQRLLTIAAVLLCMLYAGIVVYGSVVYVYKIYSIEILAQDIPWLPQWIPRFVMPLGFSLVFVRLTEILVRVLRRQQTGLGLADEAREAIDAFSTGTGKPS